MHLRFCPWHLGLAACLLSLTSPPAHGSERPPQSVAGYSEASYSRDESRPAQAAPPSDAADPWDRVPIILRRIVPPTFPARVFPITDYGAAGNGIRDCSEAFRRAIEACHRAGGGRVLVPPGNFVTGAIHLKSNVELHLAEGATLRFIQDPARYLPHVLTRFEGNDCYNYSPFIYARDQQNVAITGKGVIDGQADSRCWRDMKQSSRDPDRLREMAQAGVPIAARVFGAGHTLRPNLVEFYNCNRILVEGVTLRNGPMWTLHPVFCQNVTVRGVSFQTSTANGDGVDPESCRDVLIRDCTFATRDDAIALKAGRDADGRRAPVPCENIVVQRCTIRERAGTVRNGIAVGSEMSAGVRNVFVEDCSIANRLRGISLKANSRRGGFIEDLYFRNLEFRDLQEAVLLIDLAFGNEQGPFRPRVRRVRLERVTAHGAGRIWNVDAPVSGSVSDVDFVDCDFAGMAAGSTPRYVADMSLLRVAANGAPMVAAGTPIFNADPSAWFMLAVVAGAYLMGVLAQRIHSRYWWALLLCLWLLCGYGLQLELWIEGVRAQPIPLVENRRISLAWSIGSFAAAAFASLFHTRVRSWKGLTAILTTLFALPGRPRP